MSGNTSGALGFVQGLQGGMDHTDKRRRNKAIDGLLAQDKYKNDLDFSARKDEFLKVDGNTEEMWQDFNDPTEEDPFAVRGFNWLKEKFGFGSKPGDTEATAGLTQPVAPSQDEGAVQPSFGEQGMGAVDTGSGMSAMMADGGPVREYTDEERLKRSYGEYYVTEEEAAANRAEREGRHPLNQSPYSHYNKDIRGREQAGPTAIPTSGGGISEVIGDVKRSAVNSNTGQAIRNLDANAEASVDLIRDAGGPEATGRAVRGSMQDAGQGALNLAGGLASDVRDGLGLNGAVDFVKGFVGKGGTRDNRQPDPATPAPGAPEDAKQAIAATVGGEEPVEGVAKKAINAAIEMTPGHPDNPDQTFDAAEISASGVRPEDIPAAQVSDWARYRRLTASAAAKRGQSVEDAMMGVTKMQQDGFSSNAMQAAFLLKQGDPRGAAIAMRIAYQYFPNGSDITFGIAEGKNGPVLVGNGIDQKTGKQVGDGTPMVLNPDSIMMFADTAKDVTRWHTWTKDWHEMAQKDRQYNEIDKPQAQATLNLTGAQTRRADAAAAKDDAYVSDPRSQGGGLKQADYDRGYAAFLKDQELASLEDPARARYLADIMARIYQRNPDTPYPAVINLVMSSEEAGTLEEDLAEIGLR